MNGTLRHWIAGAVAVLPLAAAAQVIHTPHDHIPDFAARFTIASAADGSWADTSTWNPPRVPGEHDVVRITHAVSYAARDGDAAVIGVAARGTLRFVTSSSTRLRVGTLQILRDGALEIGTSEQPLPPDVTAEIIIKDTPLDAGRDPEQFGTGIVAIDGRVTMHGAAKSATFVRTDVEPLAGDETLHLERPVEGWRAGDRLFLPDTRQVPAADWFNPAFELHVEELTIAAIGEDAKSITLAEPLRFDHRGARDADGTPTVLADGTKLLPHVGNLTRNIVIRSENPSGVRGHTLLTGRAAVKIRFVQFQDLGRTRAIPLDARTNHIGRYPLHAHHLIGPVNPTNEGYQFEIVGNAVNDSLKWPIAVHGSHFGLIQGNVVFGGSQLTGSGIAVEDGTETENLFIGNFVANIRGNAAPRNSGPSTADGTTPGSAAECYWATGFNNRFIDNVAASCRNLQQEIVSGPGFKFIVPAAPYETSNPRERGADMARGRNVTVVPQNQPIPEFRGNEVYGLAADGLTVWNLGTDGYAVQPRTMGETLIKDFRVWHTYEGAIWNYPINRMTIEGLVYRIDPAVTSYWNPAITSGDYRNIDLTIRGGSIHAGSVLADVIDPLGTYRIENVEAVTRGHAFAFRTPATPGTGAQRPRSGVTVQLRNNVIRPWPGETLKTIALRHDLETWPNAQPNGKFEVLVYDYQGEAGRNFRVFFDVQTQQELYGGKATCAATAGNPEVNGVICPLATPATN